ncbi:flagellar hook-associated protein FlgK [Romboutsia maritimum]|uniref:Flagellar hook-associated protein 1 n=1 Tax=Romboutsia maritimum TaxID=2020948 RepID=A0A371IVJ1_9FIRM|nr:flagellar hook-associated protein FlgK [Romboutsia maritimum]RDY24500.1 flagellar hook-associated protein FlgK [Romboutsia maritimum]
MPGLFGTLNTAASGMSVSQTAIQTTSHNISNVNTPGYSRQKVNQSASSAYSYPGYNSSMGPGQLGTGVKVDSITRTKDIFYDFQFRSEAHKHGETNVKYNYYSNMEAIFNEPSDTAISASINNFFTSWHELSKDPNDKGAKSIVVQNSKYLAHNISQASKQLENSKQGATEQLKDNIKEIDDILTNLENLNKDIKNIENNGKVPNDLYDERDRIIDDLSFKLNIPGDKKNLKEEDIKKIREDITKVSDTLTDDKITEDEMKSIPSVSGEISGLIDLVKENGILDGYTHDLKELGKSVATEVNKILGGDSKGPLFTFDDSKEPILSVNEDILKDVTKLKLTSDQALEMYDLKNKKITIDGENITIDKYYNNTIQKLGNATQEAIRNQKNQSAVMSNIDNSRLGVSGVSLDEEMVSLIQFQHAYNASAKVVSTIDSLLDVVINGLVK